MSKKSVLLLMLTLAGAYSALVGASLYSGLARVEEQVEGLAREAARVSVQQVVATRRWNASLGGVYARVAGGLMPNPYLEDPLRDVSPGEGLELTKVNPAYMMRLISEELRRDKGLRIHLTSLRPINPGNTPDPWEQEALQGFEAGRTEAWAVERSGEPAFRFMVPLRTDQPCLTCHEKMGYTLGSIRGGVSVSHPYAPYEASVDVLRRQLIQAHLVPYTGGLLMLALLGLVFARRPPATPPAPDA